MCFRRSDEEEEEEVELPLGLLLDRDMLCVCGDKQKSALDNDDFR